MLKKQAEVNLCSCPTPSLSLAIDFFPLPYLSKPLKSHLAVTVEPTHLVCFLLPCPILETASTRILMHINNTLMDTFSS